MLRIGLIGGMSWESSALYYRLLNEGVRDRLGGLHSAECVLVSVDRQVITRLVDEGAQAVVLGCTEIELLVGAADATVPLLPTTRLHVEAALTRSLQGRA